MKTSGNKRFDTMEAGEVIHKGFKTMSKNKDTKRKANFFSIR